MKKILLFIVICINLNLKCEVTKSAIVIKGNSGYHTGDTIKLYGVKTGADAKYKRYLIYSKYDNQYTKYISERKLQLLEDSLNFWEELWFKQRAAKIKKQGWNKNIRDKVTDDANYKYNLFSINFDEYQDVFINEYIKELYHSIFPRYIATSSQKSDKVLIIDSELSFITSFNEGFLVLSTGFLSNTGSEEELVKAIAIQVAHNVLDHNFINKRSKIRQQNAAIAFALVAIVGYVAIKASQDDSDGVEYNDDDYEESYDDNVSIYHERKTNTTDFTKTECNYEQRCQAIGVANDFNAYYATDSKFRSKNEYLFIIKECITREAWYAFKNREYERALQLEEKLFNADIADEEDYLLKVKILKQKYKTNDDLYNILDLIAEAKLLQIKPLIEFNEEEAMVYSILGDKIKCSEAYRRYKDGLLLVKENGDNVNDEIIRIDSIINNLNE